MLPGHDCANCEEAPTCKMKKLGAEMIKRFDANQLEAFIYVKAMLDGKDGADAFAAIGALCVHLMEGSRYDDLKGFTTSLLAYAKSRSPHKYAQMQELLDAIYGMQVAAVLKVIHAKVGHMRDAMQSNAPALSPPPDPQAHWIDLAEMPTVGGMQ